jgi:hypothetical protein
MSEYQLPEQHLHHPFFVVILRHMESLKDDPEPGLAVVDHILTADLVRFTRVVMESDVV